MAIADDADLSDLAERIRGSDRVAEEEFVARFRERVFLIALARTGDRESSRELAQDIVAAVLVALRQGRLRKSESLTSFVYAIARHHIANHFRSESRRRKAAVDLRNPVYPSPHEQIEDAERRDLVRRRLGELSSADRKILTLTLGEGLTPREIASRLGLSLEVVRQRKTRAKRRIVEAIRKRSRS